MTKGPVENELLFIGILFKNLMAQQNLLINSVGQIPIWNQYSSIDLGGTKLIFISWESSSPFGVYLCYFWNFPFKIGKWLQISTGQKPSFIPCYWQRKNVCYRVLWNTFNKRESTEHFSLTLSAFSQLHLLPDSWGRQNCTIQDSGCAAKCGRYSSDLILFWQEPSV